MRSYGVTSAPLMNMQHLICSGQSGGDHATVDVKDIPVYQEERPSSRPSTIVESLHSVLSLHEGAGVQITL